MSDEQLQWDIDAISFLVRLHGYIRHEEALERLRARLTPDRERVARAVSEYAFPETPWKKLSNEKRAFCRGLADAAIRAMGEGP